MSCSKRTPQAVCTDSGMRHSNSGSGSGSLPSFFAGVGVGVAGFFMRVQGFKRVLGVQLGEHIGHLAHAQVALEHTTR